MGLIIPETEDGRVLFLLPWEGSTIAGTTDSSTEITEYPRPHENEIKFILKEVSKFLNHQVPTPQLNNTTTHTTRTSTHCNVAEQLAIVTENHITCHVKHNNIYAK